MKQIAFVVALILVGSADSYARSGSISGQANIRHQKLMRKARHEITLMEGVTLADPYTINLLTQIGYQYHVLDWIGVGLEGSFGASFKTPLTTNVEREVTDDPDWAADNPGQTFKMSRSGITALVLAQATFVPFSGKLVLFGKYLGYVDFHVVLGGGFAQVRGIGRLASDSTYAVMVGGGFRFFPKDFISVNLQVKDYMINRILNIPNSGQGGQKELTQNPVFFLGASIYLPMKPSRGL